MNRSKVRIVPVALVLAVLACGAALAAGEDVETRVLDDRWSFMIGGYLTEFSTDAAVGSGTALGTVIRAEDELGVDTGPDTFRVDGLFRINEKQSIGFGYWSVGRDGSAALDEQIEWDGNVYDVGAEITSKFDTSWFRVDWRYSLLRTPKGEAGFAVGISAYDLNLELAGIATVDDGQGGTIEREASGGTSVVAPVPTIGTYLTYAFKPKLLLRVEANLLDVGVGDIDARLVDTSIRLDWWFTSHFGIGGGFNTTDIQYKDRGENPISVDYRQSGGLAYLTFAF